MRLLKTRSPSPGGAFQVKRSSPRRPSFAVTTDGQGVVNHAGAAALRELADSLGYTKALCEGLDPVHRDRAIHHPGVVLTDLAVSIADGGDCLSDLTALHDQPDLFGHIASVPTAWRVIDRFREADLERLRDARRRQRERAWQRAGTPELLVLDIDATLVTAHSDKEWASGNYKHGFGFHPLVGFLEATGEALAAILRPGSAGSNTARDHIEVLRLACEQLPEGVREDPLLVRCDSAGATHDFLDAVRARENTKFSVGFELRDDVRQAILAIPTTEWTPAIRQDAEEREGAEVCELRDLDLAKWPSGTRAICRRERPHPGAQLSFTDHEGWRFQVFITDQQGSDIALLEARHRARARCEDQIRCAKDTGLRAFPFRDFLHNRVWLELVLAAHDLLCHFRRLALSGQAQLWEPQTLRYRLFHTAGRLVHRGRRVILRLQRNWPWTELLATAFARIRQLPAT
jgi:hypothetical protein